MKKQVSTREEMEAFVAPLIEENKYVIDIKEVKADGSFIIQWQEHKKYTAIDGKEFHDEVWVTEAGDIIQVQDLPLAHAHNIIRMYLRRERESRALIESLTEQLMDELDIQEDDGLEIPESLPTSKTLH